jgi:putative Holliday junction resolvase
MPRIVALDYGKKRTGIAVSDPLKMIATGLATIPSHELVPFLRDYLQREEVETVVIGDPKNLDGSPTDATPLVEEAVRILKKQFPAVPLIRVDERLSSRMAGRSIAASGLRKKQRQDKGLVDEVSATILLQDYLQTI